MIAILSLISSFLLLPMPADHHLAPDATEVQVKKVSAQDDLAIFAVKFFKKPFSELVITCHSSSQDMAESGLFDSGIYYVYDLQGNKLGIIKSVPSNESEDETLYHDEVRALNTLKKIPFSHFHCVKLLGTSCAEIAGEHRLVLAETVAKGETLNQLIKDYGKMTSSSGKKELSAKIEAGMRETGAALAELHVKSPKSKANANYLSSYNGYLPGPYGIIHGDAHPGNIFYDATSGEVTFIDFQMTPSTSIGGPVGVDIGQFLACVELMSKYRKIPENQLSNWKKAFLDSYQETGPAISESEMTYYETNVYNRYANMSEIEKTDPDYHQATFVKDYSIQKIS